jgi:hypothetical protein
MKAVARGTVLFAKGDVGTSLFAVRSGVVQITSPSLIGKAADRVTRRAPDYGGCTAATALPDSGSININPRSPVALSQS